MAGDDDGRAWWPAAVRRLDTHDRLKLAVDQDLAAAWERREQLRIAADCRYFVESYGHVQEEGGAAPEPFLLWPRSPHLGKDHVGARDQGEVLAAMLEELRLIVLKARQLGLTWLALHYGFWRAGFDPETPTFKVLGLSKHGEDAKKLLRRARRINQLLPAFLRFAEDRETRDSLTHFKLAGRGSMISLSGSPAAARSEQANLALLDEFAFIKNRQAQKTLSAVSPTLGETGQLFVISTGNGPAEAPGDGQAMAKLWQDARAGRKDYRTIFLPTSTHPRRNKAWRELERRKYLDDAEFEAEHAETEEEALAGVGGIKVFRPAGVNAAERLGAEFDELLEQGELAPPVEDAIMTGADWGEMSHILPLWPLERGGIYVPPHEVASAHEEPGEVTERALKMVAALLKLADDDAVFYGSARFDAAGIQSQRTFITRARRKYPQLESVSIAFGAKASDDEKTGYKREAVGYLRRLFKRTAEGHETQIIAISPRNPVLLRQLRGLEFPDEKAADVGKVEKGDDHGVDGLIAGVAPTARRFRALLRAET